MKTFEENISRLEELSDKIRNPEIGIEDALETFEEGIRLAKTLEKELEKIEGRIQILMNSPLDENPPKNEVKTEKIETEKPKKSKKTEKVEVKEENKEIVNETKESEFNEEDLQLDLFEEMTAPTEGLRQNV